VTGTELRRALDTLVDLALIRESVERPGLLRTVDPHSALHALNRLVEAGVVTKRLYQDNPPRNEYLLTDMGRDFFPVLVALAGWGDRWLDGGNGAPVAFRHTDCGHDLGARVDCGECGEQIELHDIRFRIGPGYPDEVPAGRDLRDRFADDTP
jgi:DNA-binding HxlR family transcriptional regulator